MVWCTKNSKCPSRISSQVLYLVNLNILTFYNLLGYYLIEYNKKFLGRVCRWQNVNVAVSTAYQKLGVFANESRP
jgi:hypothetical protein